MSGVHKNYFEDLCSCNILVIPCAQCVWTKQY